MKLREEFDKKLEQWLEKSNLSTGSTGVSVNILIEDFNRFLQGSLPVSKAMFGRAMSARFLKKQNRKTLEMEYFVDASLVSQDLLEKTQ